LAAARQAAVSAFAITQLMSSCEAVQTQLLSLYISPPLVDRHLEKSCTCADRIFFLLTNVTSCGLVCYSFLDFILRDAALEADAFSWDWLEPDGRTSSMASKVRRRSVRNAFSSCHIGISALLCRDCSRNERVSLDSLEEHMYTKRQSQFSVGIPGISNAVRQPWMVLWSSRIDRFLINALQFKKYLISYL